MYKPTHHNLLLKSNHSLGQNFLKKLLENKEMIFKEWVKNIQTAVYNGARTVVTSETHNVPKTLNVVNSEP